MKNEIQKINKKRYLARYSQVSIKFSFKMTRKKL